MAEMVEIENLRLPRTLIDKLPGRLETLNEATEKRKGEVWEMQHVIYTAILEQLPILWNPGDDAWLLGSEEPLVVEAVVDQGRQLVVRPIDPGAGPWACVYADQVSPEPPIGDGSPEEEPAAEGQGVEAT